MVEGRATMTDTTCGSDDWSNVHLEPGDTLTIDGASVVGANDYLDLSGGAIVIDAHSSLEFDNAQDIGFGTITLSGDGAALRFSTPPQQPETGPNPRCTAENMAGCARSYRAGFRRRAAPCRRTGAKGGLDQRPSVGGPHPC